MRVGRELIGALVACLYIAGPPDKGAHALASPANARADGPHLDLSNFEMTFEDNFSKPDVVARGPFSQRLFGMRWLAHTPWNGDFGEARFADSGPGGPLSFGPEGLTITATKQNDGKWRSGLICSVDQDGPEKQGFAQRYSYFEMRAKSPEGPGTWPAFWLVGIDKSSASAELDIMEYYGKFSSSFYTTLHIWKNPGGKGKDHIVNVQDHLLAQDFHTYGVLIGADHMRFFLDCVQYLDIPTPPAFKQPMYMLIDLALEGGWPINELASPAALHVAYVRAYRDLNSSPN